MDRIQQWDNAFQKFSEHLAWYGSGMLTLIAMGWVAGNVIGRYVFKFPLRGMNSYVGLMLIAITFLVMPWGWYKRAYITIGVFSDRLNPKGKVFYWLRFFYLLCAMCTFTAFTVRGVSVNFLYAIEVGRLAGEPGQYLPLWPFLLPMPIGMLLLLIRQIFDLIHTIRTGEAALPLASARPL